LFRLILNLPIDEYDKINNRLVSRYDTIILKGLEEMAKFMKIRYMIFIILSIIVFIFSLIYITIFCTIYQFASISWLISGIFCLIFFYVIQILLPLLQALIRIIVFSRKYRNKNAARIIYYGSYYIL